MGRTESSRGLAPPSHRKDQRAKSARATINKTIPMVLASNVRARKGVEASELIVDPPPLSYSAIASGKKDKDLSGDATVPQRRGKGKGTGKGKRAADARETLKVSEHTPKAQAQSRPAPLKVRLQVTDTLTAASLLQHQPPNAEKPQHRPKIAVLNMASPLRPGGGVLNGATSQEEFLCTRTTLYPSLKEEFYRLPEVGGVYTPDVLVFRDADAEDLRKEERFWMGVVSAGMLRFPDTLLKARVAAQRREEGADGASVGDEEGKNGVETLYAELADRALVLGKMRAVLRIAQAKGVERLVLGAWGCGAYGNPVGEIASAWRKVLFGDVRKKSKTVMEDWAGIEEVVFAVRERSLAREFARCWGAGLDVEEVDGQQADADSDGEEMEHDRGDLAAKIAEIEERLELVRTPMMRESLVRVLQGLREQMEREHGSCGRCVGSPSSTGDSQIEVDGEHEENDCSDDNDELTRSAEEDSIDEYASGSEDGTNSLTDSLAEELNRQLKISR